jgi:hypothetical protein
MQNSKNREPLGCDQKFCLLSLFVESKSDLLTGALQYADFQEVQEALSPVQAKLLALEVM